MKNTTIGEIALVMKNTTIGAIASMSTLPQEIQVDIVVKLPAKYIGISRCVCKLWRNLLSSSKFIKYNLSYINSDKNNRKLMCLTDNFYSVYSIEYASLSSSIPMPSFNKAVIWVEILGSCNGLVCLGIFGSEKKNKYSTCICIWNPLTRKYKEISLPPSYFETDVRHGFGYDCNNETYKLVRIGKSKKTGFFKIKVYTLGSGSWNNIHSAVPYSSPVKFSNTFGLLFNGDLHWLGSNSTQETSFEVIVAFNISTETILEVPLPEDAQVHPTGGKWYRSVAVLEENICLFNVDDDLCSLAEIWVMLEYGVRGSWTKRFSITQQTMPYLNRHYRLISALANGDLLIVGMENFVLYEPKKKRLQDLNIQIETMSPNKAVSYVESLVSPNSGTYVEKTY